MDASVEISMYPLDESYAEPIKVFIRRLNEDHNLTVETNTMSTQVFGEYDEVMGCLTEEIKRSFENEKQIVFVMKVVNARLRRG